MAELFLIETAFTLQLITKHTDLVLIAQLQFDAERGGPRAPASKACEAARRNHGTQCALAWPLVEDQQSNECHRLYKRPCVPAVPVTPAQLFG